jgi:hypothetical protein
VYQILPTKNEAIMTLGFVMIGNLLESKQKPTTQGDQVNLLSWKILIE